MAAGFPVKQNYAAGDILTAAQMNDLSSTLNYLDPTAKGDLFPASSGTALTRLAVGADGETLVADSSTSTGLRYQGTFAAGKNLIINGAMGIAQRGTSSVFLGAGSYRLDRWAPEGYQTANQQQVTTGSTAVPSYYALRAGSASTAQDAGGSRVSTAQQIETELAQNYAGKTVTLSFWVKFSAATITGAGNWFAQFGGSSSVNPSVGSATFSTYEGSRELTNGSFPTTWTKYTTTGTLASNTRSIRIRFQFSNTFNTTNPNDAFYDITGVQLEEGSVATGFTMAGGTIQGELAACQRYYQRVTGQFGYVTTGTANNSTDVLFAMPLPVQMRVAPTAINVSALADWKLIPGNKAISAITIAGPKPSIGSFYATSTGLSANQAWTLYPEGGTSGANTYIDFVAEL